jgi:Zn finger protein HypA/HybF involved in hydrogenase expression
MMGSQVTALCECGLKSTILIGGGMANFMDTCFFPCLCEHCRAVVQINLLAERIQCPKCQATKVIPYDDTRLIGRAGNHQTASWDMKKQLGRELILTDGDYKCPQCENNTLHFSNSGHCWD